MCCLLGVRTGPDVRQDRLSAPRGGRGTWEGGCDATGAERRLLGYGHRRGRAARHGAGGRAARLRLGLGGRSLRVGRGHRAGLAGRPDHHDRARLRGLPDPDARPLERTRDYVAVVRKALARERVAYRGETLELPLPGGQGKALKLTVTPVQRPLPIYLAAMGPRNLALAGEIADGCLGFLFDPAHGGEVRAALQEGAARGGRKLDTFDLAVNLQVRIDEDLDAARDAMRPMLALYVGGMGSRERNFYNELMRRYGFDEAADTVQELYLDGRVDGAAAALPPELIDAVTVCGPAGRVRERLDALREAGVTTLIAGPVSSGVDDATSQLRMLAGAAA